jgi:hypothetical protein
MTFTLSDARKHNACEDGYDRFAKALRKAHPNADIEQINWSIGDVATVNVEDALWCLRLLDDKRQIVAAIMPAVKRASTHTTDERVHFCIAEIERWLAGDDSIDLTAAADAAAYAAANAAERALRAAADAAAGAAYAAAAAAWAAAAAAAAWAAAAAAGAAAGAASERRAQRQDLIAMFPPIAPEKQP